MFINPYQRKVIIIQEGVDSKKNTNKNDNGKGKPFISYKSL